MKTLLHTCCAPCSVSCVEQLRAEGIEPVSYWFNPNIHPYQEYKARRDTLIEYAGLIKMELIVQEEYGLRDFVCAVAGDIAHRCTKCYEMRLEQTASLPPCSSAPIRSTSAWRTSPVRLRKNGACRFCIGTSVRAFAQASSRLVNWGFICRSTAAVFSARKTAMQSRSPVICRSR